MGQDCRRALSGGAVALQIGDHAAQLDPRLSGDSQVPARTPSDHAQEAGDRLGTRPPSAARRGGHSIPSGRRPAAQVLRDAIFTYDSVVSALRFFEQVGDVPRERFIHDAPSLLSTVREAATSAAMRSGAVLF